MVSMAAKALRLRPHAPGDENVAATGMGSLMPAQKPKQECQLHHDVTEINA